MRRRGRPDRAPPLRGPTGAERAAARAPPEVLLWCGQPVRLQSMGVRSMAAREVAEVPATGAMVPLEVRIGFAHASVQWIADRCGADLLHVKGAALDPTLVPGRGFSDADVLLRPAHVARVLPELRRHGWELINSFAYGSSFEHSATLRHRDFGLLDLHRLYPGAGPTPDAAFATLWAERHTTTLG